MELRNRLKRDRSGLNTVAVIAVMAILVIAAVAAFVVISDKEEKEIWAPGTLFKYDVFWDGEEIGTLEAEIVGQNAGEYFFKTRIVVEIESSEFDETAYRMVSKSVPGNVKTAGTEERATIHDTKDLEIWEYTDKNGFNVRSYADPESGLEYRIEITGMGTDMPDIEVQELTEYSPVWQNSYKQSDRVGNSYEYIPSGYTGLDPDLEYSVKITCVADGMGGHYGMFYEFTIGTKKIEFYQESKYVGGLPNNADYKGIVTLSETPSGLKLAEEHKIIQADDSELVFYCDPMNHKIYEIYVLADYGNYFFTIASGL